MHMVNHAQSEHITTKTSWLPWCICFVTSLFFFYEFIQGNMFASIADNIMADFHIQVDKMTYLSSIYYVSNVLFLFVAGIVLDRYSPKKIICFAMLLCVISTFVLAYAQSFSVALICRFITGIGSAFCFLGPIRIASRWFEPKQMALVTGIIVTIAMTGGMLAQYPLTKMVVYMGWRHALMSVGWLGIGIILVMLKVIRDKPAIYPEHVFAKIPLLTRIKLAYLNPQTLRAALYGSLMNMAIAVFGAMMGSLYLMQRLNISKEHASFINSMLFLGAIVGGPIMGWCSDKIGRRVLPMKIGACLSLGIILCILYVSVSFKMMSVLFFLLGLFTASQIISYALVAESSPQAMTATAVSIVSILTQSGYVIYQNIFSYLLKQQGHMTIIDNVPVYALRDFQFAATLLPIGLLIALLVLFGLKETYCRRIAD